MKRVTASLILTIVLSLTSVYAQTIHHTRMGARGPVHLSHLLFPTKTAAYGSSSLAIRERALSSSWNLRR